jgi:hypothetical protein
MAVVSLASPAFQRTFPANMVALFQQFLASMANKDETKGSSNQERKEDRAEKSKLEEEEPAKEVAESSAEGEARGINATNNPYCYSCLTRGHPKEECDVNLFCDVCESTTHVKCRCPLFKKAKNLYAMACGYVVDGLGFYYIPHSAPIKPRAEEKTSTICVIEGEMAALQVKTEMERLVPRKTNWVIQEMATNKFKTAFPTKGELHQMIEWGMVQTKEKMVREECGGGSSIKQAMRKVWVQMAKLPSEFKDFLTIWAVGTILRVTKDVNMSFMRHHNRARL